MSEEMNGRAARAPSVAEVRAWMKSFIQPAIVCVVNGVLRSMPQIPVEEVMVMICGLFGSAVGATLSAGDIGPILQLRKRCKDAFVEELGKIPVRPMPAAQGDAELVRKLGGGNA
jgi:hypothetical protein